MTDEQAMWRVQMHDDGQAFAQLVSRWEGPIQRLCLRMLNDEHKAEDVTQEAFAKVYAKRKEFHHGSKFSTFLWRVATNLCLDELRRVKRAKEIGILPHVRVIRPFNMGGARNPADQLQLRTGAHVDEFGCGCIFEDLLRFGRR